MSLYSTNQEKCLISYNSQLDILIFLFDIIIIIQKKYFHFVIMLVEVCGGSFFKNINITWLLKSYKIHSVALFNIWLEVLSITKCTYNKMDSILLTRCLIWIMHKISKCTTRVKLWRRGKSISCETNVHDSSCYSDYKINTTNTICVCI